MMCGSRSSSRRVSVVLPAPEGDEITNSSPRRLICVCPVDLFNVLHLLAHLIDHRLEGKANGAQGPVLRFGAKSVGFAVKLLGEKIKFAAHRSGIVLQELKCRRHMGEEAIELFLNIAP